MYLNLYRKCTGIDQKVDFRITNTITVHFSFKSDDSVQRTGFKMMLDCVASDFDPKKLNRQKSKNYENTLPGRKKK